MHYGIPAEDGWQLVAPPIAKEWIEERNSSEINRNVSLATVKYFAGEMTAGHWKKITDSIGFRRGDGMLINGQHRLLAIIESGVSVWLNVMVNLDPEAYLVIDRGRHRSVRDALRMPLNLASDAVLVARICKGTLDTQRISEFDQRDTAAWWAHTYNTLTEGVPHTTGLYSAPTRVGFGLRWAQQNSWEAREYVLGQYRAFLHGDHQTMNKAVDALWSRAHTGQKLGSGDIATRVRNAAYVYYHTDLKRVDVRPAIRTDTVMQQAIDELRGLLRLMEPAYVLAARDAEHPYDFNAAIQRTAKRGGAKTSVRNYNHRQYVEDILR